MTSRALVISDGGLASAVATFMEGERGGGVLYVPADTAELFPNIGAAQRDAVLEVVREQAALLAGAMEVVEGPAVAENEAMKASRALLEAVARAVGVGGARVAGAVR